MARESKSLTLNAASCLTQTKLPPARHLQKCRDPVQLQAHALAAAAAGAAAALPGQPRPMPGRRWRAARGLCRLLQRHAELPERPGDLGVMCMVWARGYQLQLLRCRAVRRALRVLACGNAPLAGVGWGGWGGVGGGGMGARTPNRGAAGTAARADGPPPFTLLACRHCDAGSARMQWAQRVPDCHGVPGPGAWHAALASRAPLASRGLDAGGHAEARGFCKASLQD